MPEQNNNEDLGVDLNDDPMPRDLREAMHRLAVYLSIYTCLNNQETKERIDILVADAMRTERPQPNKGKIHITKYDLLALLIVISWLIYSEDVYGGIIFIVVAIILFLKRNFGRDT